MKRGLEGVILQGFCYAWRWEACLIRVRCRANIRTVESWSLQARCTVRNMQQSAIVSMRSTAETRILSGVMDVHGKGFETSMLQSIRSVSSATLVEYWFLPKKFITSCPWVKVAHMIRVIWLHCASRVTRRFMQSVETAGMTGDFSWIAESVRDTRGSENLWERGFYRTAGGSCVRSREMEEGDKKKRWFTSVVNYLLTICLNHAILNLPHR